MRAVSKKRARLNRLRRQILDPFILEGTPCEVTECPERATDGHEIRTRGRGGSIIDLENIALICRGHHRAITENPDWALRHGWVVSSWASSEDQEEAWSVRHAWSCETDCELDHRRNP